MNPLKESDKNLDLIEHILQEKIRPALALHKGNIQVSSFEDGILSVRLTGQCMGCAWASSTMNNLVKKEIMDSIPTVKNVILDDSIPQDMLDFAKKFLHNQDV